MTSVSELELDLDVFQGPFDLLLAVLLREEISLAEVELGEIVLAYIDHLEEAGELDLEAVTEFLVLIAALLELKSRLLLPGEPDEGELGPQEAADELLARMLEYRRYSEAGKVLERIFERERGVLYRSAPPPPELRRAALKAAGQGLRARPARISARRPADGAARPRHAPHPDHGLAAATPRRRPRAAAKGGRARLRRGLRHARTASPRR